MLEEQEREIRTAQEKANKTRQELGALQQGQIENSLENQNGEQSGTMGTIKVTETDNNTDTNTDTSSRKE